MDAAAFTAKYPGIEIEQFDDIEEVEDEDGNERLIEVVYYVLKKIPLLEGVSLKIGAHDFARVDAIIESKPALFKDLLGARVGKNVEVVLTRVRPSQFGLAGMVLPMKPEPIKVSANYEGRQLQVHIYIGWPVKTDMGFLATRMIGIPPQSRVIATISGLADTNKIESDTAAVLRSVLFDLEYSYQLALEAANFESLKRRAVRARRATRPLPTEEIQLLIKPYVPELIEYYHTAERVDYVPFKYICYFHIVEYFMDKSAHRVISKRIKQIMMRPDFHVSHAEHMNEAIKIFRVETEKNMTDKIKITRVLAEYLQRDEIRSFVEKNGQAEQFTKEHVLAGPRALKVQPISFESDAAFYDSLGKRIYAIRCSIVHSNPDFDESKAVPFHPSPKNIDFLRGEVEIMREVSNKIIANSID